MSMLFILLLLILPVVGAQAQELDEADIDVFDTPSLRRGAHFFATYCSGCHSIKHIRYSRLAEDLKMPEDEVKEKLMAGEGKFSDGMTSSMNPEDGEKWFGAKPPDLSLSARARGPDWLYTYLRSFYLDESRPFGVNNLVFENVAMPNVLWELQGHQKAVYKDSQIDRLELVQQGSMTPAQFDRAVNDLVNFLVYVGEPAKLDRLRLGKYVILFLALFAILTYRLKKEYWKDIH